MLLDWWNALHGGLIIGFAVSLMLILNGRVTGISGIIYALLNPQKNDILWRVLFVLGLVFGGLVMFRSNPDLFATKLESNLARSAVAGLLVGFGTILGSGCTSGHGVCGISRLSVRSVLATLSFMIAGILSVFIFKQLGVV